MELKVTRYEVDEDGVATVRLHRPDRGNSWTGRMHAEYRWIMARLEADPAVRVAVLTGSGDAFCVGADAEALDSYVDKDGYDGGITEDVARPGYGVSSAYDADVAWQLGLRFPLICAVNGSCAGVALAMAAFSDVRFGLYDAKVTTATPKLAMPVEYGLSWILPRLIGLTHAADILLSGRVLRAQELGEMSFFNAVYGADEFPQRVAAYARELARLSPEAMRVTKRQLYNDVRHDDPGAAVERSKELISELMREPDYQEGVRALIGKRPPRFGRETTGGPPPEPHGSSGTPKEGDLR